MKASGAIPRPFVFFVLTMEVFRKLKADAYAAAHALTEGGRRAEAHELAGEMFVVVLDANGDDAAYSVHYAWRLARGEQAEPTTKRDVAVAYYMTSGRCLHLAFNADERALLDLARRYRNGWTCSRLRLAQRAA